MYGADIKASLFEKDVEACGRGWNFSNLESILTRGLSKEERENLHGVRVRICMLVRGLDVCLAHGGLRTQFN